ncbi:amidase [Bradyrhizobium sp. RDT10]
MTFRDYGNYDAVGLADLVRNKEVTPKELLDEAIARIERVDAKINAVVVRHYDYARRQIDEGLPAGPFSGVPFLLKDDNLLEGTRTTFGANIYQDNVADHSSVFVERFLKSGVAILGKTGAPELSLHGTTESRLHGPTHNPWDPAHSAGGSSGGSAAAVAARIVPVAAAGDGGGSIRIPASACGVFGLKPTRARTPVGPDRGQGWGGFFCPHVVSLSVRDSAAMLDALCGPEPTSPYHAPPPERPFAEEVRREPGRLRIAFTAESRYDVPFFPELAQAVRDTAALLEKLGHHVEERKPVLPVDPAEVLDTIVSGNTALTVRLLERRFGRAMTIEDLETATLALAQRGRQLTAGDYVEAELAAFQISRALAGFFAGYDLFLSPTLCQPPLRLGEIDPVKRARPYAEPKLRAYFSWPAMFNMSGQPAMSVPLAWSSAGLPLGMMFAGRFGEEATLLRLAIQLERERPWRDKRPAICA